MEAELRRKLAKTEFSGVFIVLAAAIFMRRLYVLSGKELIGVLFGSVNSSCWEMCKTLLLPYLCWAAIELLCIRPSLHRLMVCKVTAVYLLCLFYLSGSLLLKSLGCGEAAELILCVISVIIAFCASFFLYQSPGELHGLFSPALFMLFLLMALYFSLTPFPPRNPLFADSETGLYGLIPDHIDKGAIVLDTLFYI